MKEEDTHLLVDEIEIPPSYATNEVSKSTLSQATTVNCKFCNNCQLVTCIFLVCSLWL
ncbi:hypothetical protein A3Q56_00317 [Intoshia linei]|uniref:Uncharacterized protein n=1 Tax=Intoshia linei TaxID=1819745 RepID=A0A177BC70_9BILA|nr:hypothetical protein A3Q56_00317 [Intoshia linei]